VVRSKKKKPISRHEGGGGRGGGKVRVSCSGGKSRNLPKEVPNSPEESLLEKREGKRGRKTFNRLREVDPILRKNGIRVTKKCSC